MKNSRKLLSGIFASMTLAAVCGVTAPSALALEDTYDNPTYKRKARLDFCYSWGKFCGQKAADTYCWAQGYDRATHFTTEPFRPTRLASTGQVCNADFCVGFKSITCFIPGSKRLTNRGWPQRID